MAIPLLPWEPHVFPKEIQMELRRRSMNRGLNPVQSFQVDWTDDHSWMDYRGPMSAWVRVCSNGAGPEKANPPMRGFVFYGGKDFFSSYGFTDKVISFNTPKANEPNKTILGYTVHGSAHILDNDKTNDHPIHVPNPEIERITATIQKEILRRARIEWTCFSFKQLEYMTPYFLVPGITCIIEWGWNHFNPLSLLQLDKDQQLREYFNNPYPLYTENILMSKGNYEVIIGTITNFEWSIEGNKIKCVTEVTSKDRLYAGIPIRGNLVRADEELTEKSSTEKTKSPHDSETGVLDSFKRFVVDYVERFKDLPDKTKDGDAIVNYYISERNPLHGFIQFLKERHPNNYKDYLFGIFYGRDEKWVSVSKSYGGYASAKIGIIPEGNLRTKQEKVLDDEYANKEKDFDAANPRADLWLNMGLVMELMNFFGCSSLKGFNNESLFLVDVDDCIISAHPNLISTDGDILLIPNAMAPKYHTGQYGAAATRGDIPYEKLMQPASQKMPIVNADELEKIKNDPKPTLKWANYRMRRVLLQGANYGILRDDLSQLINAHRYKFGNPRGDFEFPFTGDYMVEEGGELRVYEAWFTGFFKNLYLNTKVLKELVQNKDIVTLKDLVEAIFAKINQAAAGFWKFKLTGATGRSSSKGLATMKVIDENLTQLTSNVGEVFTFDYNAADGLIQQLNFRPMLSNAQAIRTIYAQTNLENKQRVVMSGQNELLDYKFKDRLFMDANKSQNKEEPSVFTNNSYKETMAKLQSVDPLDKCFQMTTKDKKTQKKVIFRLAIPPSHEEILYLLLDDDDRNHNPRYTGIMPGIQAEITIQGIAGIRTFSVFRIRGLPEPYSEREIVFRVINCNDTVQNGQWTTQIVAGILPLRAYFCSKLRLPPTEAKSD